MDFPHCFLILLSICGHYCIYFCAFRNSEITMREMVVTIRLLMTPFLHAFICCRNDFLLFVCCTRVCSNIFSVTLNFECVMKRTNTDNCKFFSSNVLNVNPTKSINELLTSHLLACMHAIVQCHYAVYSWNGKHERHSSQPS